jgi:nitrite reductase/ring-hydroxylating ferredoxin subunit
MHEAEWYRLGLEADIAEGTMQAHGLNGWQVLVARSEGKLTALNDRCTHQAARLSTGRIRRGAIMCPLHGARFDLADGRCIGATYPALRQFELRVVDGSVEVLVPAAPPGMQETPVSF